MIVIIETSEGTIKADLDEQKAPVTVANFMQYVDEGFYDGTVFHRVIPDFMIQGGGLTSDMKPKGCHAAIVNEAGNGLANRRGTLAMARTSVVNSATSQFFINTVDNGFLDHRSEGPDGFGYAVFGRVVEGMEVVDRIQAVPTRKAGPHENVPATPVVISSVRRAEGQ